MASIMDGREILKPGLAYKCLLKTSEKLFVHSGNVFYEILNHFGTALWIFTDSYVSTMRHFNIGGVLYFFGNYFAETCRYPKVTQAT